MTTAQVIISVGAVLAGQLLPQLIFRLNTVVTFGVRTWWIALLPPAWFAGFDDALAGSAAKGSWVLAALADPRDGGRAMHGVRETGERL